MEVKKDEPRRELRITNDEWQSPPLRLRAFARGHPKFFGHDERMTNEISLSSRRRRDLLIQGDYCRGIYPTELKSWETGFSHMLNSFILTTKCSKKSTKVTQRVEFAVFYSSNERVKQPCRKKKLNRRRLVRVRRSWQRLQTRKDLYLSLQTKGYSRDVIQWLHSLLAVCKNLSLASADWRKEKSVV